MTIARHEVRCTLDDIVRESAKCSNSMGVLHGSQTIQAGRDL